MNEIIGTIGTYAAFFALADLFALPRHKHAVAAYLFGQTQSDFSQFERGTILALLSPLVKDRGLRMGRVFVLSLVGVALSMYLLSTELWAGMFGQNTDLSVGDSYMIVPFLGALILATLTYPFDYWSVYLTRFLFIDNTYRTSRVLLRILFDFVVSLAPIVLALTIISDISGGNYVIDFTNSDAGDALVTLFAIGALLSGLSVVYISLLQIAVLLCGYLLRRISRVFHFNQKIAENSNIKNAPFTCIGALFGLIVVLLG